MFHSQFQQVWDSFTKNFSLQRSHFVLAQRQCLQLLQFAESLVLDARDTVVPQISV